MSVLIYATANTQQYFRWDVFENYRSLTPGVPTAINNVSGTKGDLGCLKIFYTRCFLKDL